MVSRVSDVDVQRLAGSGAIRRIPADEASARIELQTARSHLRSAETLRESDANAAFQLAYDGARKAIAAHMRAKGYRVGPGQGAHVRTGQYALAALSDDDLSPHLDAFEDMRRVRNQSEYDAVRLEEGDARDALVHARAIVDAVERDLQ